MKIAIFTQNERLYLPIPIGTVVEKMHEDISFIALSPPMSTHGGNLKGFLKHIPIFGIRGIFIMCYRVVWSHLAEKIGLHSTSRKYWSMKDIANKNNIPIIFVDKVNSQEMHDVIDKHPSDLLVSVSCPQILGKKLFSRFKYGAINVHSAPLPKYRGLMPGFWILYNGEKETAVTVHEIASKIDNGDILFQKQIKIASNETWDSLIFKTKTAAGIALIKAIEQIKFGNVVKQLNLDTDASYFSFPTAQDASEFRARGKKMF